MMPKMQRTRERLARLAGRIDNRLNPIMAKEMYQSVNSRAFLVSFWALLAVALVIYTSAWASQEKDMGAAMFAGFYVLMGVMGLFVLPLWAFFNLRREIVTRTIELVHVTGIGAERLARGHLLAVAARLVLLCSMLAPFTVLSYLFGGIDVLALASYLYLFLLCSLAICAMALWCAAMTTGQGMRYFPSVFFVGLLGLTFFILLPSMFTMVGLLSGWTFGIDSSWGTLLGGMTFATFLIVVFILAMHAAAAHMLKIPRAHPSSSRSLFQPVDRDYFIDSRTRDTTTR